MKYETVIGLEIHAELRTESKMFCGCSTAFGAEPNTQCCPVCTGQPGALPVVNRKAVTYGILAGLGTHCTIAKSLRFDRKNYFYPDLPKGYQISQLYEPLCQNGHLALPESGKVIRIREIHLEEDAGKLVHDRSESESLCDYNRCGVPLIEIVTQPDFTTPEEVCDFVRELRRILLFLGISDGKMQEGSLRVDVNLSVRPVGETILGTRTEMKNLNSLRAIQHAIDVEAHRQIAQLAQGNPIIQETRRWDETAGKTFSMRVKEEQADYRYFPEPDLPPTILEPTEVLQLQESLPPLPEELRAEYRAQGLSDESIELLLSDPALARYYEAVLPWGTPPKTACNWILGEVLRLLKEHQLSPEEIPLRPEFLAETLAMLENGTLNREGAKETLAGIFVTGTTPAAYVEKHHLKQTFDTALLTETAKAVLKENPKAVQDYLDGNEKSFGFLMGQCMKRLGGKGNPDLVRKALFKELQA